MWSDNKYTKENIIEGIYAKLEKEYGNGDRIDQGF